MKELIGNFIEKLYETNNDAYTTLGIAFPIVVATIMLFYRIYAAKMVELILEAKKIENVKTWKWVTFIFGVFGIVLCFIINFKVGEKIENEKVKRLIKKYFINALVFGLIVLALQPFQTVLAEKTVLFANKNEIEYYHKAFFDENENQYVCYDKMGNVYKASDDFRNLPLYDKDGNKYLFDDSEGYYYCTENKKKVLYNNAYIDEAGYFVGKNNLSDYMYYDEEYADTYRLFCYDEEKNIYYPIEYCSWDKDGNLLLRDSIDNKINNFDFEAFKNK